MPRRTPISSLPLPGGMAGHEQSEMNCGQIVADMDSTLESLGAAEQKPRLDPVGRAQAVQQVDPRLVSVVIQGPLYRQLAPGCGIVACIASIHRHLPGAEVIVSTWHDEDIAGLDVDRVVLSDDPGSMRDYSGNVLNTNRQLVSTLAGIEASTRPYVMKFRSDHCLTSSTLASIGNYDRTPDHGRLFSAPITVTNLFIRNPARCPMLWHMSDLCQFGRREDMLVFWKHPIFKHEELFNPVPKWSPFGNYLGYSAMKMNPEQSYMIGVLRRHGLDVHLSHPCEITAAALDLWESVLCSDFRVLEWKAAGVNYPERFMNTGFSLRTIYSVKDIAAVAMLSPAGRRGRRLRVWVNQYLLGCLTPTWWISFASLVLFALSPTLAKRARGIWRRVRRIQHPSPEKA
ncbi:WavE lipopolysaccharide synthesis [compost metagenome]